VLAWPGMPAPESLAEAARRLGRTVKIDEISSNEALEARMERQPPFDLVFPSDYLVERLAGRGSLLELERADLPLERLASWARNADYDHGCRWSVPFAYGTTGYLCDDKIASEAGSWALLLAPPDGVRVGMLSEVREVVGAALIATGRGPNDVSDKALAAAELLLEDQRPHVVGYDSDDFVGPVTRGEVAAHHAWSGPASNAVRHSSVPLRYVVPDEGAILWRTTASIPADAPEPSISLRLLGDLMDAALAARTTTVYGYATPNEAASRLLPSELRDDRNLFPDPPTLARCHTLRDLGDQEQRLTDIWDRLRTQTTFHRQPG
jgi:spermidine/putrescine transport system substrate-binding protein